MKSDFNTSLAPFTTLRIGGPARVFIAANTEEEIQDAIRHARAKDLPLYPLGAGSNILVPDEGVEGVVLKVSFETISFERSGEDILLVAGAGVSWDRVVDRLGARGIFGIENLAGIPGTLGGAVVQNIGAYGAEFANVFDYADVIDRATGEERRVKSAEAAFRYRTSFFKEHHTDVITRVALRLTTRATPNITYADLAHADATGIALGTPIEIAKAVRAIRALKFPQAPDEGTAGSFFKNPVISGKRADSLAKRFAGLPTFREENGSVKVSLAWILDHALGLKGFAIGRARLYEKHPLVIVTQSGATAAEVEALATEVEKRVVVATSISIEREVETFGK